MAKDLGLGTARKDLRTLLEERNKQNAFLREQLAARIQHVTHLEARLLGTLDALDELHVSSARELERAQRENKRLLEKLNVCQAIAGEAENEKNDMSNAVLQLVAKVESCDDYSRWRASRIKFSQDISLHPMCPSRTSRSILSGKDSEECTCAQAYSPAVIEELSDSLAKEKRAHALTLEEAERRIAVLQSHIAIRDAEITRRATTCQCLPNPSSLVTTAHLELLSDEDRAHLASRTAQRNLVLGEEVTLLEEKLSRERRPRGPPSRRVDQSIQTESMSSSLPPCHLRFHQSKTNADAEAISNEEYDVETVALSTLDSQIVDLRKSLSELISEKEALRAILRNELEVEDSGPLLSPQKRRRFESSGSVDNPGDRDGYSPGYDERVKGLDEFKDVLLLEEECIRLMHSEDNLHSKLGQLQQRYAFLSQENARLKAELSGLRSTGHRTVDRASPLSLPPLDTSAIDLAFPPLQPDMISPVNGDKQDTGGHPDPGPSGHTASSSSASSSSAPVTPTSLIDPSEIPLPRTPTSDDAEHEFEIDDNGDVVLEPGELPAARPPSPPGPQEPPEPLPSWDAPPNTHIGRDVQTIERELADARADAEMRDHEIAEMRNLMADLALRISDESHRTHSNIHSRR